MRIDRVCVGPVLLVLALLLTAGCPSTPPEKEPDGGSGDGGETILCVGDSDCPPEAPHCRGGVCSAGGGCASDADCPNGTCNLLTGQCEDCPDCCTLDTDCQSGYVCSGGRCQEETTTPCSTADDCEVGQVCQDGNCKPYDDQSVCVTDADCPRDHRCNALQDGRCEGCLNDAFCQDSPHGPKCDTTDDGVGPGPGYCYKECGTDVGDCPMGMVCDTNVGGLCVPACSSNSDCSGGLICKGGRCEPCQSNSQCDVGKVCEMTTGSCVDQPTCSDAQCQSTLGQAYYCDQTTQSCRLGCTPSGCSGGTNDCNPCPAGQTCNTATRQCEGGGGGGCDCASLMCETQGQVCDAVSCTCITPGGGGNGTGMEGDACLYDQDCVQGMACFGALPDFGLPGECAPSCSLNTFCLCEDPARQCQDLLGVSPGLCIVGATGRCVVP